MQSASQLSGLRTGAKLARRLENELISVLLMMLLQSDFVLVVLDT